MSEAATLPNVKVKKRREIQKLSLWDVLRSFFSLGYQFWNIWLNTETCRWHHKPRFYGQMRTYQSICRRVDMLLSMCDKRIFLLWKGGVDSLFSATQVEPSLEKEKLAAVQKKVKIKRSLKKWVMEKPWNLTRQISSIKKLLGILVFEEKPSSARRTLPI